jgi:enoyl-CoA hydratase/carnithine racemase
MENQVLKCSVGDDSVAILELNRPNKRNALSQELIDSLVHTITALQKDDRVHVVVLTGAGGSFSGKLHLKNSRRVADFISWSRFKRASWPFNG